MRLFIILSVFFILTGCAAQNSVKEPVSVIKQDVVEEIKPVEVIKTPTGWSDKDTYTVSVTAADRDKAREAAKHKILHDIVKVRMLNESRFTDITKISAEFDRPLKEGKIISEKTSGNMIEIYFQIRESGLKDKFERK